MIGVNPDANFGMDGLLANPKSKTSQGKEICLIFRINKYTYRVHELKEFV